VLRQSGARAVAASLLTAVAASSSIRICPNRSPPRSMKTGRPIFWPEHTAIHVFRCPFLRRIDRRGGVCQWPHARKKVPSLKCDRGNWYAGGRIRASSSAVHFRYLPASGTRWTVTALLGPEIRTVQNATGRKSSGDRRAQAISEQAGRWLEANGVKVPSRFGGKVDVPLEISPLAALDERICWTRGDDEWALYLNDFFPFRFGAARRCRFTNNGEPRASRVPERDVNRSSLCLLGLSMITLRGRC